MSLQLLWSESCIDAAAEVGRKGASAPCRDFVAQRHSRYLVDSYFCGDFPTSAARIPTSTSLFWVILQDSACAVLLNCGHQAPFLVLCHFPNFFACAGDCGGLSLRLSFGLARARSVRSCPHATASCRMRSLPAQSAKELSVRMRMQTGMTLKAYQMKWMRRRSAFPSCSKLNPTPSTRNPT